MPPPLLPPEEPPLPPPEEPAPPELLAPPPDELEPPALQLPPLWLPELEDEPPVLDEPLLDVLPLELGEEQLLSFLESVLLQQEFEDEVSLFVSDLHEVSLLVSALHVSLLGSSEEQQWLSLSLLASDFSQGPDFWLVASWQAEEAAAEAAELS